MIELLGTVTREVHPEGHSDKILARAGEASTGKALYPCNCLPSTHRHPLQV